MKCPFCRSDLVEEVVQLQPKKAVFAHDKGDCPMSETCFDLCGWNFLRKINAENESLRTDVKLRAEEVVRQQALCRERSGDLAKTHTELANSYKENDRLNSDLGLAKIRIETLETLNKACEEALVDAQKRYQDQRSEVDRLKRVIEKDLPLPAEPLMCCVHDSLNANPGEWHHLGHGVCPECFADAKRGRLVAEKGRGWAKKLEEYIVWHGTTCVCEDDNGDSVSPDECQCEESGVGKDADKALQEFEAALKEAGAKESEG